MPPRHTNRTYPIHKVYVFHFECQNAVHTRCIVCYRAVRSTHPNVASVDDDDDERAKTVRICLRIFAFSSTGVYVTPHAIFAEASFAAQTRTVYHTRLAGTFASIPPTSLRFPINADAGERRSSCVVAPYSCRECVPAVCTHQRLYTLPRMKPDTDDDDIDDDDDSVELAACMFAFLRSRVFVCVCANDQKAGEVRMRGMRMPSGLKLKSQITRRCVAWKSLTHERAAMLCRNGELKDLGIHI